MDVIYSCVMFEPECVRYDTAMTKFNKQKYIGKEFPFDCLCDSNVNIKPNSQH